MHIYDCQVFLGGSRLNQVPRFDVTAPEIMVLRAIHGSDSVVNISHKHSKDRRTSAFERARLVQDYGPEHVKELFGPEHHSLPQDLPAGEILEDEDDEAGEKPIEAQAEDDRPDPLIKARAVRAAKVAERKAQEAATTLAE